jgi:cardiolipin synthase (CMP-forming)
VLAVMHLVPLWLVATVVARDLIIVLGALAYRLLLGPVEARPSDVSKLNTLCQAFFIVCVIARQEFEIPAVWVITILGALTFLTTAVSGLDYILRYGKAALKESRSRRTLEQKLT